MNRRHTLLLGVVALLIAAPAISYAAQPKAGQLYIGKVSGDRHYGSGGSGPYLRLRGGRHGLSKVDFPQICGFTPTAVIKNVPVSHSGAFSKKRTYTVRIKGARSGGRPGGKLDLVLIWKATVSGKFSTATKATGKLSIVLKHHLEDQSGANPPGPLGDEKTCPVGPLKWRATPKPNNWNPYINR